MTDLLPCYRSWWVARYEREHDNLGVIWARDPFKDWQHNEGAEILVLCDWLVGMESINADIESHIGRQFLERACEIADRALAEAKFEFRRAINSFPLNRSKALRMKAYATGILHGCTDPSLLRQASDDLVAWLGLVEHSAGKWDTQRLAYYLAAVRCRLIVGDWQHAGRMLRSVRRYREHTPEAEALDLLCRSLESNLQDLAPSLEPLWRYFHIVRNPEYRPGIFMEEELLRVELGAILVKYSREDRVIDWRQVIEHVSA